MAPRRELVEITSGWPRAAKEVLAEADFAAACLKAPFVDARIVENAGHCIDFHYMGASFQLEQLAFALSCGVRHAPSP